MDNRDKWVHQILEQRDLLNSQLGRFSLVKNILPSDANFLMVKFDDPKKVFNFLIEKKIIVRDRSKVSLCEAIFALL